MTAYDIQMIISKVIIIFFLYSINLAISEQLAVEIENPRFYEKGLDENAFEIKAKKGIQKGEDIELSYIEGKFQTDDGSWIYLRAKSGKFSKSLGIIELEHEIYVYSENNENITADFAIVNIKDKVLQFKDNVEHYSVNRKINSNFSEITENFENIIFKGNVIAKIIGEN